MQKHYDVRPPLDSTLRHPREFPPHPKSLSDLDDGVEEEEENYHTSHLGSTRTSTGSSTHRHHRHNDNGDDSVHDTVAAAEDEKHRRRQYSRSNSDWSLSHSTASGYSSRSFRASTFGLVNEGCTCYLNALLQLLYHTGYFRAAVYRIPDDRDTDDDAGSLCGSPARRRQQSSSVSPTKGSVATHPPPRLYRALQELFYLMQVRTAPNRTQRLTDSFGWRAEDLLVQHDIQEMAALLRDRLEARMKGTVAEGEINLLFEGRGVQIVRTLDGTFTSRRPDVFYDIHLPISSFTDLYSSLHSLTNKERLDGDNKYLVEEKGRPSEYKDAVKSYRFLKFPPVVWFHLKRFAMDMRSPMLEMRKINSRFAFPLVLDLTALEHKEDEEREEGGNTTAAAAAAAERTEGTPQRDTKPKCRHQSVFSTDSPAVYDLHGVIVHRGTVASGHYICFIREWDDERQRFGRWIKYDDESVTAVDQAVAVDKNYGGSPADALLGAQSPSSKAPSAGTGQRGTARQPRQRESAAKKAVADLYDGLTQSTTSAYMVAYIRRGDAATVLAEPSPSDISACLRADMKKELDAEAKVMRREQERRESLTLHIITDRGLFGCTAAQHAYGFRLASALEAAEGASASPQHYNAAVHTTGAEHGIHYPVDFTIQVRKTDLVQNVYGVLIQQPPLRRMGLDVDSIRLWRWDPVSGGCATGDRSWNGAACQALPTHAECRRHTTPFTNFIPASDLHRPVEMYLYLQEPTPFTRVIPALSVTPLVRRFQCIEPGTYKISLRKPVHAGVLSLVLATRTRRPFSPAASAAPGLRYGPSSPLPAGASGTSGSSVPALTQPASGSGGVGWANEEEDECGLELHLLNTTTGQHRVEPLRWFPVEADSRVVHIPLRLSALQPSAVAPNPNSSVTSITHVHSRSNSMVSPIAVASHGAPGGIDLVDDITILCVERNPAYMPPQPPKSNKSSSSTTSKEKHMVPPASQARATLPLKILDVHIQMSETHMKRSVSQNLDFNDGDMGSVAGSAAWDNWGAISVTNLNNAGIDASTTAFGGVGGEEHRAAGLLTTDPQLPMTGTDRILVFFKFFDYLTCTVRYIGSALIDRCCTLRNCEPLLHHLVGFPSSDLRAVQFSSRSRHQLSFYVEERSGASRWRELGGENDLWNLRLSSGCVVLAQFQNVPPIYRHTLAPSYLAYVEGEVSVTVIQIKLEELDNREAVVKILQELKTRYQRAAEDAIARKAIPPPVDPFQTTLPAVCPKRRKVVRRIVCRMNRTWTYLAICDAVAEQLCCDPNRLLLYYTHRRQQSPSQTHHAAPTTSSPAMEEDSEPVPLQSAETLAELVYPSLRSPGAVAARSAASSAKRAVPASPQLVVEVMPTLRSATSALTIPVTLRDEVGRAIHHRQHSFGWTTTLTDAVREVFSRVETWERDFSPYGSFTATAEATHFIAAVVDVTHSVIARIAEVPMNSRRRSSADATSSTSRRHSSSGMTLHELFSPLLEGGDGDSRQTLKTFSLYFQPCVALQAKEVRVACCHADYGWKEGQTFGHPFIITVTPSTTVREGLELMLRVTRVPLSLLSPAPHSVMMRTNSQLSFSDWEDHIMSYWKHTPNPTPYVPSLVLNHTALSRAAPRIEAGKDLPAAVLPSRGWAGKTLMIPREGQGER